MKRLTERDEYGCPVCNEEAMKTCCAKCGECDYDYECFKRLADYEDAEEQGRLVVLPCKIVDVVYRVCKKKYDVDGYGMQWEEDWGIVTNTFHLGMFHEIGKNVFLTREEAEEILRRKQKIKF